MIILLYITTILLLLVGFIVLRVEKRRELQTRITTVLGPTKVEEIVDEHEEEMKLPFSKRILSPILTQLKRNFQKKVSNEKKEKLDSKLDKAGNPKGMTAVEFRLFQMILLILLPLGFGAYTLLLNMAFTNTFLAVLLGLGIALYFPNYYLKQKTTVRNKQAQKELPDFLDLLTVSIEAGLGFDSALSKVVAKRGGVLSNEFQRCLEEMRLGKTRREALSGIRDRLDAEDVKTLIGSIIQAEQLGIGMVQILRVQSNEIREKRKQRAEEQAMKAPIKMLFPLVIFIFPCIFIVLLGPAIIGILETF